MITSYFECINLAASFKVLLGRTDATNSPAALRGLFSIAWLESLITKEQLGEIVAVVSAQESRLAKEKE